MATLLSLHTPRAAAVDALRQERASAALQVLGIVGFALLTALGAQVRLYLWEVPFTLQTVAVYGSGLFLGWRNGMLAQVLYLTLGLFLPVYAGDTFGPAYLFGAVTAGYLLAYPLAAAVVGALSKRWNTLTGSTLAMIAGSVVLFTLGVVWLHAVAGHATWAESLERGWLRFIPVDLAKILFVGLVYTGTRRLGRAR
ncbi:MAG: biotin biosynthesis protein BioY [Rhodothermaceae bacterium]|nr:MAG: biotin biosynthesis protein BioY [Rhodothermaceae bacterium]